MTRDAYVAQAAALQVASAIRNGSHFFCDQLPTMDVNGFLTALRDASNGTDLTSVSLALVGYPASETEIDDRLSAEGIAVGHLTTDLHLAAQWRNEPEIHSTVVVLASGRYPGVSTLAHFPQGDIRAISRRLLRWARTPGAELASTAPQTRLLRVLEENGDLSPLVSLNGVAEFLSTWKEARVDDELGAPRRALPRLGILPDRNLLNASDDITARLLKNLKLTQDITKMSGRRFEETGRRVERLGDRTKRSRGLDVLERAERIRHFGDFDAYRNLDFEEALEVFQPTASTPNADTSAVTPPPRGIRDSQAVTKDASEFLIDGEHDALKGLVDTVQNALTDAVDGDEDTAAGRYEIRGDERTFEIEVKRELLTWVRSFCSPEVWGGFFEVPTASIDDAIRDYRQCEPTTFEPLRQSIAHDGRRYSVRRLIEEMQSELSNRDVTAIDLSALWDEIVAARRAVLAHLDILIHQPLPALAGQSSIRSSVADLLCVWDRFYTALAESHTAMHDIDYAWTQLLFEAVASLDVVQIKAIVGPERTSWKAVLLPTHPLHLWRYERIAALAGGLGLDGLDRAAVLEQLRAPEHYLGVIYLTSFPEGKGGSQPLAVARDYGGLAVFENLRNAYSGDDGVGALQQCIRQFAQIYVNHTCPVRLALVNPPNASRTLVTLLRSQRASDFLRATIQVDIYATPGHEDRLLGARRFSIKERDQIEAHIAAKRLRLRVHEETAPLDKLIQKLKNDNPVHIMAVFDEATTAMRYQSGGANLLPMSPFAIRRRIRLQGIQGIVDLAPSLEDSVFRSFYEMTGRLYGALPGQTPQASADAERMAGYIHTAVKETPFAAFWFFFADRVLPSSNRVRAARILERYEGRRRSVCYDASYQRLALLLRPALDRFNLRFLPEELQELLKDGIALLGDLLVDLFKIDAQPDLARVRGFAGMLIAARDYGKKHSDALLVSVDTKLARLWLRLTDTSERCDLLALRREGEVLLVEALEVKTAGIGGGVRNEDIRKAEDQLVSTLQAIQSGLEENEQSSPLAAPRREMLKEVFVSGCQALAATKEDRTRWAKWLKLLFRETEKTVELRLRGIVYAVELGNNRRSTEETINAEPHEVILRRLREERIQRVVSMATTKQGEDDEDLPPSPTSPSQAPSPPNNLGENSGVIERGPSNVEPDSTEHAQKSSGIRFVVGHSLSAGEMKPYYLSPSNTKLNQLNIGVVGDLGTGKTQLTKALIYQFTRQAKNNRGHAPKFLIFDYKHDYTKADFVESVGARVVKPHRIPLNVFDLHGYHDHRPAARLGRVKFLNDVLQKIYGGIGPRQRNQLKTSVMRSYEAREDRAPTLADVFQEYADLVGKRVDAPYSILSDLVDYEVFVKRAAEAQRFGDFFSGVTVIDLASSGIGDKERNMLLVLFLNLYYEYMINLVKQPYVGHDPQLRFIDSMLLVDEADNIMKFNFDVLRQILLQGREYGVGVLLASQFLSHFKTRETDYSEPLLTWFIHKVPNVTSRELQSIGLNTVTASTIENVKTLDVHQCLFKTLDVPGRFMKATPFYEVMEKRE